MSKVLFVPRFSLKKSLRLLLRRDRRLPFRFETLSVKKKKKDFAFIKQLVKKERKKQRRSWNKCKSCQRTFSYSESHCSFTSCLHNSTATFSCTTVKTSIFLLQDSQRAWWRSANVKVHRCCPSQGEKLSDLTNKWSLFSEAQKPQYTPVPPEMQTTPLPHKIQTLLKASNSH